MLLKVMVKSALYNGEYIGIKFDTKKNLCDIGGKDKMSYECQGLIQKYFVELQPKTKSYKNNITRLSFSCSHDEFMAWIEKLSSHGIGLQFTNSLERIMR